MFYKKPVIFGLVHLFFASFAFILPLFITESSQNIVDDSTTNSIFSFENKDPTIGAIMLCTFMVAMFLSLSGFSCSYYRFKVEFVCVLSPFYFFLTSGNSLGLTFIFVYCVSFLFFLFIFCCCNRCLICFLFLCFFRKH